MKKIAWRLFSLFGFCAITGVYTTAAIADDKCDQLGLGNRAGICAALTKALQSVAPNKTANGGLGNNMWGTIVDQDGVVCAVTFTGNTRIDQ